MHTSVGVGNAEKTSLLVVDDDTAIRKLLERIAQRAGFAVDTARDGAEALELLRQKPYAIAIVDLMMPRVSGYELVQQISTITPRPVVIVATAMTNGDHATLDDSMVRRVIRKPFDVNAVAQALVDTARRIAEERREAANEGGVTQDEPLRIVHPEE
ncbi:MAG TPA: response regulator [Thermoanaerobaculia bacterium]|nr:response regulator [Thermoanaerobaculia bacterium]